MAPPEAGIEACGARSDPQLEKLIDAGSIKEYTGVFDQNRRIYGDEVAMVKTEEHIKARIEKTVSEQKSKRKRDVTSVGLSTMAGTAVPYSGIPIAISATVVQCIRFSCDLGLIPASSVRSVPDLNTLSTQLTGVLTKASTSGMKSAVEGFVIACLEESLLGDCGWMWEEVLKGTVHDFLGHVILDGAWIVLPVLTIVKYKLHRHLIKKMYQSVGTKAITVHCAWARQHLYFKI